MLEQTITSCKLGANLENGVLGNSIDELNAGKPLTLCDPVTMIAKRIAAFFTGDPEIHCKYIVNNSHQLGPTEETDEAGNIIDHPQICEFRLFVDDPVKAQAVANVIRHEHVVNETYEDTEGHSHVRAHKLLVRVFELSAVDPLGPGAGSDPYSTEDNTDTGIKEIFGIEPIDWEQAPESGCNDRTAIWTEVEQRAWEDNPVSCAWKWSWLKTALTGNKHVQNMSYTWNDGMNTWRFIECARMPVVFAEDNLTCIYGLTSVLPAELLPLIFAVFGKFQISTYARASMMN